MRIDCETTRGGRTRAGARTRAGFVRSRPPAEPVTVDNFVRAESDLYFGRTVSDGAFGQLKHNRTMAPIDKQIVVRMNRDTIYSSGVFDLDAAPVTITLPDVGGRFMSMQVISQDHYAIDVVYAPARYTITRESVGTRYACVAIRTLANPLDLTDMTAAHAAQDAVMVEQATTGSFDVPEWDAESQGRIRDALAVLGASRGFSARTFGRKDRVDPVQHLIGTATGWGGNPASDATYVGVFPKANDGRTVHTLTVKDVPVDAFWSVSVYDEKGYFAKNDRDAYSLNNLTAQPNPDGSFTIQFGGCEQDPVNCLPITPGWNYVVRLYRPRPEILAGTWTFPLAQPVR